MTACTKSDTECPRRVLSPSLVPTHVSSLSWTLIMSFSVESSTASTCSLERMYAWNRELHWTGAHVHFVLPSSPSANVPLSHTARDPFQRHQQTPAVYPRPKGMVTPDLGELILTPVLQMPLRSSISQFFSMLFRFFISALCSSHFNETMTYVEGYTPSTISAFDADEILFNEDCSTDSN